MLIDLMIGDWLQHANGNFYQVTRIDALLDGNIHFACGTPHLWEYNNEFKPIPLTEEILEKNGFEYYHKNYASLNYNHPFKLEMKKWPDENGLGGFWVIFDIIEIRFVHQLQNALRLCGISKEIKL